MPHDGKTLTWNKAAFQKLAREQRLHVNAERLFALVQRLAETFEPQAVDTKLVIEARALVRLIGGEK